MPTPTKPLRPIDIEPIAHELSRENNPDSPVVRELRRQVANAFVLYANYKHYDGRPQSFAEPNRSDVGAVLGSHFCCVIL